jgi:hypothetical protein
VEQSTGVGDVERSCHGVDEAMAVVVVVMLVVSIRRCCTMDLKLVCCGLRHVRKMIGPVHSRDRHALCILRQSTTVSDNSIVGTGMQILGHVVLQMQLKAGEEDGRVGRTFLPISHSWPSAE